MTATEARFQIDMKPGEQEQYGAMLVTGFSVVPQRRGSASAGTVTTNMIWTYFRSPRTIISSQVKVACGIAAVATPTLVRIGLYTVDPTTGALLSLIASTANDTSVFGTINSVYTKSWSSPVNVTRGQWYALAVLQVSGAATAQVVCGPASGNNSLALSDFPKLVGSLNGQADLPATVAGGSVAASQVGPWGVIL